MSSNQATVMLRKIKLYSLALKDIENGFAYYQTQQKGLGKRFESNVNTTFKSIQKFPFSASLAYNNVRYKIIKKFPYIILYEFDEKHIYILRIFNTHLEPLF
jgi:toxin ParE1/3/4